MIESLSEVNSIIKGNRDCIVFYILLLFSNPLLFHYVFYQQAKHKYIFIFKTQHI